MGDHRAGPGRAEGRRGRHPVRGGGPVPFRRAHPGYRDRAPPARRRARGRRRDHQDRPRRHPRQGGRPGGVLVHPRLRHLPVLLHRPPEPVRRGQERGHRLPGRRDLPLPRRGPGPGRHVRARHVLPVRRAVRVVVREDRGRHPVRAGRPGQLRGDHGVLLVDLRRRRAPGRDRGGLRHRRGGHQRRPGRPVRRGQERHRRRPGRVQARAGHGVRRHARLRRPRAGARAASST